MLGVACVNEPHGSSPTNSIIIVLVMMVWKSIMTMRISPTRNAIALHCTAAFQR